MSVFASCICSSVSKPSRGTLRNLRKSWATQSSYKTHPKFKLIFWFYAVNTTRNISTSTNSWHVSKKPPAPKNMLFTTQNVDRHSILVHKWSNSHRRHPLLPVYKEKQGLMSNHEDPTQRWCLPISYKKSSGDGTRQVLKWLYLARRKRIKPRLHNTVWDMSQKAQSVGVADCVERSNALIELVNNLEEYVWACGFVKMPWRKVRRPKQSL